METSRVDYSAGYLESYKGLQLEEIKAKGGPEEYVVDEGAELGASRSLPFSAIAAGCPITALSMLSW